MRYTRSEKPLWFKKYSYDDMFYLVYRERNEGGGFDVIHRNNGHVVRKNSWGLGWTEGVGTVKSNYCFEHKLNKEADRFVYVKC